MITYYHLQMTFIPSLDEKGKFFIWMTQPNGEPIKMSQTRFQWIIGEADLAHVFTGETDEMKTLMMEWNDEFYEVEGVLVDMWRVYLFLQNKVANTVSGAVQIGESFLYWETVARSLDSLIRNGHYYPTMYAISKDSRQFIYAQWMLSRNVLDDEGSLSTWLKTASPLIFAFEHLATSPIREWQNLMIDLWTDQVIKLLLNSEEEPLPFIDQTDTTLTKLWHKALTKNQSGFFHVVEEKQQVQQLHVLVREIRKWHSQVSSDSYRPLEKGLIHFKQQFIQSGIKPEQLVIHCKPVSSTNLMLWDLDVQLKGLFEGRNVYLPVNDSKIMRSHTKRWVEDRLDYMIQMDDNLYQTRNRIFKIGTTEVPFSSLQSMKINEKLLASMDIQLLFPEGWDLKEINEAEVDVSLSVSNQDQNGIGLGSILEFDWRIAVGELSLSVLEFKRLVEQQQFLIQQGQKWISLPARKLEKIYDELIALEPLVKKRSNFSSLVGVKSTHDDYENEIDLHIDRETKDYLQSFLQPVQKQYVVPESFTGTLRPYQQKGYEWLRSLRDKRIGACLADDMGLGKTIQAIVYLLDSGQQDGPHLIVCPTSVLGNWKSEFGRFAPSLNVLVHHGIDRLRNTDDFKKECSEQDVIITSYSLVVKDQELFQSINWNSIILDEAQMIKNPATKQSKAVRALKATHRITLTGTPMENKLEELWSISDFLNPGYLGYRASFQQQFIRPIEKKGETERINVLKRLIQPFLLRRSKMQTSIINDLPEKFEEKVSCPLTKEQASLYQSVVEELKEKLFTATGMERRGLILGGITRLKQVCNHPSLLTREQPILTHSGKMQQANLIINEKVEKGENVLLFTQYVKMGKLLKGLLKEIDPESTIYFLHGGVPSQKREELLKKFKEPRSNRCIFILSIKAGGVGLNLTEANHVIHLDRWWNPAVENQATDRAYRIGQQQNVQVYKMITKGTLEEGIDRLIDRKSQLTSQIVTNQNQWVTELSDSEFIELIQLREKVLT
ncbi:DEAD/DEAH box helicase [Alkalihalobacillus sp. AL-G]|uniref:DEAD/DEAH box helicase n=1 Tax=Alkalihalobacillus sp. AL-G TaxID=2926399 RepID=UPI0027297B08|nr:SNF2-related protein [Alkalihalobacillus sp. AL-G]WLD91531.1 DEAD/DEAH box helicase [Alkalihalobacillus sp. AL-G]